jgi:inorganic pyrophosphatase
MRLICGLCFFIGFLSCCTSRGNDCAENEHAGFLHHIAAFSADSLVNVVVEIPAGTNQKWEVNKVTGQIEWEQVSPDSFRVVDYLPYPANYGFVPQTLLSKATGGDGDPVDVFVLGSSMAREQIVAVRIVGVIHLLDNNESDSKLLAVCANGMGSDVVSLAMLQDRYPGAVDIIKLWLLHYKGSCQVNVLSVNDEADAMRYLNAAHEAYVNQK